MEESGQEKPLKLHEFIVGSIPTVIYLPNFISASEQSQLLHHIYQVPASRWKSLKNRRLQNWGGVVHEKGLLPQDLPPWLKNITNKICDQTGLFPSEINHVLINEYLPDQGIMPHQDGPAYFPVVAILSLISPLVIDFTPHQKLKNSSSEDLKIEESKLEFEKNEGENENISSLLLMPCSLLIFKNQAYSDYLHGIKDSDLHSLDKVVNMSKCQEIIEQDGMLKRSDKRVSLTCRLVLKVHKKLFKF